MWFCLCVWGLFIFSCSEAVILHLFQSPPKESSSHPLWDTLGAYFIQSYINNETVSSYFNTKLNREIVFKQIDIKWYLKRRTLISSDAWVPRGHLLDPALVRIRVKRYPFGNYFNTNMNRGVVQKKRLKCNTRKHNNILFISFSAHMGTQGLFVRSSLGYNSCKVLSQTVYNNQ